MDYIEKTIHVFEALRKNKYKITLETGEEIILSFFPEHYHHLVGFQHLDDLPLISAPKSKRAFYTNAKNGKVSTANIACSSKYKEIEERVKYFDDLTEILSAGEGKIIVDFDKNRLNSEIVANYYLYKRVGNPLFGEPTSFRMLFIGYNAVKESYYPATFIVEHTPRYIRNQKLLTCSIELL